MKAKSVLVVDDDPGMCETTSDILDTRGYEVVMANDGYKAIERIQESPFDLVLMDVLMPGINGVETYKRIKLIRPQTKVIMMTAYAVGQLLEEATKEGVCKILSKPLDVDAMLANIEALVEVPD